RDRLTRAMHGVDLCVHAAALKRVEGSSTHARELLKTNTLGTANVIDAALDCGVRRTIFLSSDKAALATNAYGKSKALAEDLIIEGNTLAGGRDVRFSAVKYGNILGSTGSVLHLWDAAVAAGRPIPLTDERMTRFYMPVNRAVGLVAWAVGFMRGGEIFSADMPRVRLLDLLRVAHPDHPYRVLGERPGGEKLHETLIGEDEARHATEIPGRFIIWPQQPDWDAHYTRIGVPLPEGYALTSNTPPFAGATQIQTLLDEAGYTPLTTQTEERRVA
ncbi:MAG TPA: polysaccharide biosynthesis protein, partial [Rhodothermales bacterium]|nr:polysaccharide biosynthesis protein [Rhodothermales bacterium]